MSNHKKDLKSCPFCSADEFEDERMRLSLTSTSNGYFAIICSCGATGPIRESEDKAIEAWNTREPKEPVLSHQQFPSSVARAEVGIEGNLKSLGLSVIL